MIDQVIERLKATVPALKVVGGSIEFQAAAESNPKATPAAFVYLHGESPSGSIAAGITQQQVAARIGVVLVVRNLSDTKGAAAGIDLQALRNLVKEQIYGWEPAPGHAPLLRGEGSLLLFRDGHVWWQDLYSTYYYDRSIQ